MLITLRVKDSEGVRFTRTMRRTDKLLDLIGFYLTVVPPAHMAITNGVFMHYGRRVTGDKTPADYDMEDGDEVSLFPDGTRTMPVTLTVKDSKGCRITRTMHRFNVLNVLFDLYYEMLPSCAPKEGFFTYHGREVSRVLTPARCDMKDGDDVTFVPISKPSMFVTLTLKRNNDGCSVTCTMRRTDKLQDLIDFYFAIVPTDEHGEWAVMYYGRQVEGEKTPADYEMEDGDHLRLVPVSKRSMFVTVNLVDSEKVKSAHTLRRTDELQDLMDLCSTSLHLRLRVSDSKRCRIPPPPVPAPAVCGRGGDQEEVAVDGRRMPGLSRLLYVHDVEISHWPVAWSELEDKAHRSAMGGDRRHILHSSTLEGALLAVDEV
ncbi:hypothetical protein E2562_008930 [Oryza meyeriana var. granulata]|uniref:Rad60/SUMO-like domain-containing protein n=1 Tax=Oryza meyeriana var. granulata TaxID=110450 RepID=A0A6G1D0M8_9ORYZ|nr:hypothetical protein E2562_008930 [Oryza meyeriana var. granulata]